MYIACAHTGQNLCRIRQSLHGDFSPKQILKSDSKLACSLAISHENIGNKVQNNQIRFVGKRMLKLRDFNCLKKTFLC